MGYENEELYVSMARAVSARRRCLESGNDYAAEWDKRLKEWADRFPSGSGFDSGTELDLDASTGEKLVFHTSFHHMNDGGFYDGWTEHTVTVRPSLEMGIRLTVSGRDRNDIKNYIHEMFNDILSTTEKEYQAERIAAARIWQETLGAEMAHDVEAAAAPRAEVL